MQKKQSDVQCYFYREYWNLYSFSNDFEESSLIVFMKCYLKLSYHHDIEINSALRY